MRKQKTFGNALDLFRAQERAGNRNASNDAFEERGERFDLVGDRRRRRQCVRDLFDERSNSARSRKCSSWRRGWSAFICLDFFATSREGHQSDKAAYYELRGPHGHKL